MNDDCELRTLQGEGRALRNRMHSIQEESEPSDEEHEESSRTRLPSLLTNGLEEEFVRQLAQGCPSDLDAAEGGGGVGRDDDSGDGGGEGADGGGGCEGSLLQRAARAGLARAVTALLRAGADPNACGAGDAEPPLVAAARLGHDTVLQVLLRVGKELQVEAADARGDTALHHAARAGRARAVALLLQAGAHPGRRNRAGQAALGVAEATALLDFCVSRKDVQGEDYDIELDFSSLVPAIENSDDCFTESSNTSLLPLQSEMRALYCLASTKHLVKELDHPIIHVFLEMKLFSMGALAYLNAEFLMVYNFFSIVFTVSSVRFSVDRERQMTRKSMISCSSENESITFLEEIFSPVCVENFICDPVWLTVLGGILFVLGLVSAICKICQCGKKCFSIYLILCLWYFNLLFIILRLTTNHLRLPSHFFGHAPAVISSFILIDTLFKHPIFSYSINLFKLVSNKYWIILVPHCVILIGIIVNFYVINIIIHAMSYLNDSQTMHSFSASSVILNTFLIVGEAIHSETTVLAMKVFIVLVTLLAVLTANTMMNLASSKIESIDAKLARRIQYTRILFVLESERLIIYVHNCLVKLPFVPYWIIRLFKSAVLFHPERCEHICKATWKNSIKTLIANLPCGKQCALSHELSDRVMKIGEDYHLENYSPDIITPDVLENELSDLEKNVKTHLYNLQNNIQTFITEQNSILQDLIKELDMNIHNSQNYNRDMKEVVPEHFNIWQKQIRVYNSTLAENINNSHANIQTGFGRLEKTLGEMMNQLDSVLKINQEEDVPAHCENQQV